jgi:hypothetical protein
VLTLFAKFVLIVIGFAFGLFCMFLANIGTIRLYGWSQTGRLAPPHYPGLERYDVISFAAEPLRAVMEIGGNSFLVVISVCGLVAVILTFWRGLAWMRNWPHVLPFALVLVFWATAAAALVGRTDWILPASVVFGSVATGTGLMFLRQKGLAITARVSDVVVISQRNGSAHAQVPGRGLGIAAAALLALLAVMKLMAAFGS